MRKDSSDYFLSDEEFCGDVGRDLYLTAPAGTRLFVDPPSDAPNPVTFVYERDEDGWFTLQ